MRPSELNHRSPESNSPEESVLSFFVQRTFWDIGRHQTGSVPHLSLTKLEQPSLSQVAPNAGGASPVPRTIMAPLPFTFARKANLSDQWAPLVERQKERKKKKEEGRERKERK